MADNQDMEDTATLRAFETFFGTHLAAIVNVHRIKPWERAREDLFMAVKALNTVLRKAAKIKGHKDISLSLIPKEHGNLDIEKFDLQLALNGDTGLVLDTLLLATSGKYPVCYMVPDTMAVNASGAVTTAWAEQPLEHQEALVKRIWSHFENPQCDLVKLLSDKYWP